MTQSQADTAVLSRPANGVAPRPAAAAAANYLKAKVLTATPEQLQLMLYDGAIRFAEQGKLALAARTFDKSFEALTRAQDIVSQLKRGLRPDVSPEVCANLARLYDFAHGRLVQANLHHEPGAIDDALRVLRYQRETWTLLMADLTRNRAADVARTLLVPSESAERVERLSVAV